MSCCTYRCTQGPGCPIRAVQEAQQPASPLITANTDGSCPQQNGAMSALWVRIALLAYAAVAFGLAVSFFWH
jgi:hypothetical protein